jgi:protein SCO1
MIRPMRLLLAGLLLSAAGAALAGEPPLPQESIYRLDAAFSDQQGHSFQLADRRGRPQLVAMFYTSCKFVCPLIIDSVKGVENALTPAERDRLSVLLVSIDPDRDDTAALASVFAKRRLDAARWALARTEQAGVRKLAALLGVRYRALADGEFNHTSTLYLLDTEGRKLASSSKLGPTPDPEFVAAVRALLGSR